MRVLMIGLAVGLVALMPDFADASPSGIRIDHSESPQFLLLPANTQEAGAGTEATMRFHAFSREFDFRLVPNRRLLDAIAANVDLDGIAIYRGEIAGAQESWARFVIADGVPRGLFSDGATLYAVEAVSDASGRPQPLVYRLDDLVIDAGTLGCSHVAHAQTGSDLFAAVTGDGDRTQSQAPGASMTMDLGLVADFEFTSANGSGTDAEMLARINIVDGIFSTQLGVQLTVTQIDSFASSNDPFSDTTDSSVLLDDVSDYRSGNAAQRSTGLTHLFTGRDLDGSNVGIAYGSALCLDYFGTGLTQGTHTATIDALIAAHEIGHNFGAPHDGTPGSPCESTPMTFLMAPSVNGSDQFSSCSITEMQDNVAAAPCITPLPTTDIGVFAGSVPGAVFVDDTVDVAFDVNSVGTQDTTGVTLDVTLPTNVTVDSTATTAGSCSTGAGTVSCALGTIAGGSGVTVTLSTTAVAAGNASFIATGAADFDANAGNNQQSSSYTVNAAVDLAVLPAAAAQVDLNAAITLRPIIENRASMSATNVALTITPDAGLRIDSASWAGGGCAIDGSGVATCQAASLAGQGNEPVDLRVTGIAEGARAYTILVSADETDRDPSNNDRAGQVTVGEVSLPPAPEPEESGGGSMDWLTLLMLLLAGRGLCRRTPA